MEIPTSIKRRVTDIECYLDNTILNSPSFHVTHHKERYLEFMSRSLSIWFVLNYYVTSFNDDYHTKVNETVPFMKYLFRTKLILHWEKMNELDSPTFF
jgi:predicted transcriptional regulator